MTPIGSRKEFLIWTAAAMVAGGALVMIVIGERGGVTAPASRSAIHVTGDAAKGAALFGSQGCSICHSVAGSGGRLAPDLAGHPPGSPAMSWLMTVLWNHAPGMWRQMRRMGQSYPQLNQQQMANMLAFLYEVGNTDPPGDPSRGQRIFEEKGCFRCHKVNGEGGTGGPDLSGLVAQHDASAWTRAMWNHSQEMVAPVTQLVGSWPQFDGASMNDLMAYTGRGSANKQQGTVTPLPLRGQPDLGWTVFQAKCIQCHAVRGQGGTSGPGLGPETDLPLSTAQFAATLWNHAPAMAQRAKENNLQPIKLEGDDIANLASFLSSLRYYEPTGSPYVGEKVFMERGCSNCHGPNGDGGKLAPTLRRGKEVYTTVSFTTALWKHGPKMVDRLQDSGSKWPVLKPADVGDLIAFLNAEPQKK